MSVKRTYLDYNATAPLRPEARTAMLAALDEVGNPSSVHAEGRRARSIIEIARESVARLVGAAPSDVIFTSGATEANNWVIASGWPAIVANGIEHDSVRRPIEKSKSAVTWVGVGADGVINEHEFAAATQASLPDALAVIQLANNETGVIQPAQHLASIAREHHLKVHIDAVQAVGRIPVDVSELGADSVALSAHKIGGPKGVGALVVRNGDWLPAMIKGGGQERRRRSGTENVAAIAGFGAAAEAALRDLAEMTRIDQLRSRLEQELKASHPNAVIIGAGAERLVNTVCIAVPRAKSETLLIKFDLAGFAISAGSACSSGKVGDSATLKAMGVPGDLSSGAIRISIGHETTADEIDAFIAAWRTIVNRQALAA